MIFRLTLSAIELFLIGLDVRLIWFSRKQQHYDAVLAEISYLMFVGYAAYVDFVNRDVTILTFGVALRTVAALIGIAGLVGIARHLTSLSRYVERINP